MKFTLPLPPSINRTYKTGMGKFYKSRESHDWETEAGYMLLKYRHNVIAGPVKIKLDLYYFRDSDIDSRIKALLDTIEKSGMIKNDMDVHKLIVTKHIDKDKPRVEIEITKL